MSQLVELENVVQRARGLITDQTVTVLTLRDLALEIQASSRKHEVDPRQYQDVFNRLDGKDRELRGPYSKRKWVENFWLSRDNFFRFNNINRKPAYWRVVRERKPAVSEELPGFLENVAGLDLETYQFGENAMVASTTKPVSYFFTKDEFTDNFADLYTKAREDLEAIYGQVENMTAGAAVARLHDPVFSQMPLAQDVAYGLLFGYEARDVHHFTLGRIFLREPPKSPLDSRLVVFAQD